MATRIWMFRRRFGDLFLIFLSRQFGGLISCKRRIFWGSRLKGLMTKMYFLCLQEMHYFVPFRIQIKTATICNVFYLLDADAAVQLVWISSISVTKI